MNTFFNFTSCGLVNCKNYKSKLACSKCGRNNMLVIKDRYEKGVPRDSSVHGGLFTVSSCVYDDCKHIKSEGYCLKCTRNNMLVIKDRYE